MIEMKCKPQLAQNEKFIGVGSMKNFVFVLTVALVSSSANAESFVCQGTGRFAEIGNASSLTLQWAKEYQKVLIENPTLKVQVYIDKSNSDGTHYLGIDVMDLDKSSADFHGAKGSLKDMVQYIDSQTSLITCIPASK
jgi:hypothetical protein